MALLDPDSAAKIVMKREDAAVAGEHVKYAYRFKLLGRGGRHLAISRRNQQALTVYINKLSRALEPFPQPELAERLFPGVQIKEEYRKGSTGSTGDLGLASSAGQLATLDPIDNDVLRLWVSDAPAFERLLSWYAGDLRLSHLRPEPDTQPKIEAPDVDSPSDAPAFADLQLGGREPLSADETARIMSDPVRRQCVERYAVDLALEHYRKLPGYRVTERGRPFDLECVPLEVAGVPPARIIHVEVKGTVGDGKCVHLTRNEVHDARHKQWRSDLFIVSKVELRTEADGVWRASAGLIRILEDYSPADADLTPIDFEYRVPTKAL